MSTLREAAQQALEALERLHGGCTDSDDGTVEAITIWVPEIIDDLRAALAEPVQEPVAWLRVIDGKLTSNDGGNFGKEWTPLYTAPRKPLAEWQINDLIADIDPEDVCTWSFRQGVYAAEKHHGVKP